jgi:nucleotide-binding universal stress UspA family protein
MGTATDTHSCYRNVVLAYDGSECGRRALREGAELARRCGAHAHLLAVMRLPLGVSYGEGFSAEGMMREEVERAQAILDEGIAELKASGVRVDGYLRQGDAVAAIAALARETHADLVVVGHQRRDGLRRWWHTAAGDTLLDQLACSILVVQSGQE